jgi:hypothetical protein
MRAITSQRNDVLITYVQNKEALMTPEEFIRKWGPGGAAYSLNERQGAQSHFMDICQVLGVESPHDLDNYCFERGGLKLGTGRGFADVWKRNCFAWEYKAPPNDPRKD